MKKTLIFLSIFFVILSFTPSLFEIYHQKDLPLDRVFVLEHNYTFDYNFYLSRIREGIEGRRMVVEKYYNKPHQGSLFQIFYLLMGKTGSILPLDPGVIYHSARVILGLFFLLCIVKYITGIFNGFWQIVAFLFVVTGGSWPIPIKIGNFWRFSTYMGWWSVTDSLQRITFLPHVILGQLFILLFIWIFSGKKLIKTWAMILTVMSGLIMGIVFPPTLIVVYTFLAILSIYELMKTVVDSKSENELLKGVKKWLREKAVNRTLFILLTVPAFIYLQMMFRVWPWKALALFDIQHRIILPYLDYALSLGPVLPLGLAGGGIVIFRKEKKLIPAVFWIITIVLLIVIFENIPQQSPSRFTEAAINIPLGILAAYLIEVLWQNAEKATNLVKIRVRLVLGVVTLGVVVLGLLVMVSMVGWLTDQARFKREGTFLYPSGAQLIYPLKGFMEAIYFLKNNSNKDNVVLAYEAAGNYIPAYAGNYVYLGHANTPDERNKKITAQEFFEGSMKENEAKNYLKEERISYVYFGPQEREFGVENLTTVYPFISNTIFDNEMVKIYKVD